MVGSEALRESDDEATRCSEYSEAAGRLQVFGVVAPERFVDMLLPGVRAG